MSEDWATKQFWHNGKGSPQQQHFNISDSSRDLGGLRVEALHMDEQWLACAIKRRRTGTLQRTDPPDGCTAAAQIKSMSSDGLSTAQLSC